MRFGSLRQGWTTPEHSRHADVMRTFVMKGVLATFRAGLCRRASSPNWKECPMHIAVLSEIDSVEARVAATPEKPRNTEALVQMWTSRLGRAPSLAQVISRR